LGVFKQDIPALNDCASLEVPDLVAIPVLDIREENARVALYIEFPPVSFGNLVPRKTPKGVEIGRPQQADLGWSLGRESRPAYGTEWS
jgi:hypothetical protein